MFDTIPALNNYEENKLFYAAEMTHRQFKALYYYLSSFDQIEEIKQTEYFNRIKPCKNIQYEEVYKWLKNSWNTENILILSTVFFEENENYFALQWSFPQVYYAAFASTLAYFKTIGNTETSHTGVLNKFGQLVADNKYPKHISFCARGSIKNMEFVNINKFASNNSLELNPFSIESCQTQICQFLKSTREHLIKEKRVEKEVAKNYKTEQGKIKQNLTESEWAEISTKVNNTSILNLLYRKRIKSNYNDIDTFTFEKIEAQKIHASLIKTIASINLVHEAYIYKAIGSKKYITFYEMYSKNKETKFLDKRLEILQNNI